MVRRRVKVSVRVRGWRLLGRVYGWATVRARLTQTRRQCGFKLGLGLELRFKIRVEVVVGVKARVQ